MEKNAIIQEIENRLGISLNPAPDVETCMSHRNKNTFVQGEDGQRILALNLHSNGLPSDQLDFLGSEKLAGLQGLNLFNNELTALTIGNNLSQLKYLNLSENKRLEQLSISNQCRHFELLDLNECAVRQLDLPSGLSQLRKLDVSRNKSLENISFADGCPALVELDLSENKLSALTLPTGFTALQYLYLNDNELKRLQFRAAPAELRTLHLRNNQLNDLPHNFLKLKKLDMLYMHGNPWEQIPPDHISEGEWDSSLDSVRNYLQSLKDDNAVPNDEVKLVLLGNSTVGKSSLVRFLVHGKFDKDISSTHGIHNEIWEKPRGADYKVNIWDFGGQEFYHATHRLFLSANSVALVLFESTTNFQGKKPTSVKIYNRGELKPETVDLEHFPYTYWLNSLEYFSQSKIGDATFLVQSKMDAGGARAIEVSQQDKDRYGIPVDRHIYRIGLEKAAQGDEDFLEDYQRFEKYLLRLLDRTKARYQISEKWLQIKDRLRELSTERKFLTYAAYETECNRIKEGISNKESEGESELETLTKYLHNIGVILYYRKKDYPQLEDTVFINPEWVTDTIYKVLDYGVITDPKRKGRFDRDHVVKRVKDFDPDKLIALMKAFELIFNIKDKPNDFVAPQYLPAENPEKHTSSFLDIQDVCRHHAFSLHYPTFMPRSVMTRFICRYGYLAERDRLFWNNGIVVKSEGELFLVERADNQTIHVKMNTPNSDFISRLFADFHDINRQNEAIQVSCNGEDYVTLKKLREEWPTENTQIRAENGQVLNLDDFAMLFGSHNTILGFERVAGKFHSKTHEEKQVALQKILYLCATPKGKNPLRFTKEMDVLKRAYWSGRYRQQWAVPEYETHALGSELTSTLLKYTPGVLHVSLHASKTKVLYFVDENGGVSPMIPGDFRSRLENYLGDKRAEAILISACNSIDHAAAVAPLANHAIGMQDFIPDEAAILYSEQFYKILFNGGSVEQAHRDAVTSLQENSGKLEFYNQKYPIQDIPVLFKNGQRL